MLINSQRLLLSVLTIASLGFSSSIHYQIAPAIAIDISQNNENKSKIVKLYREGETLFKAGKYQDAIVKFEQSLVICRSIGERTGEGTILSNLGTIYRKLEQYPKAINYYQQALVISRQLGDRAGERSEERRVGKEC